MKLGNLYNFASIEAFVASGDRNGFQDSQAGIVLARNLTHVDPKIFEKKYPDLVLLSSGVDVDNSGGYANVIQSLRILEKGGFTVSNDQDDNKGKITIAGEDSSIKVYGYQAHSTWTDDEVKAAELQNINLPSQFLAAHNKIYQQDIDRIGLIGMTGGVGLLNTTAFTADSAAGAAGTLTAIQLYQEIADLITDQHSAVNNTPEYKANVVVMPTRVMNIARSKLLNQESQVVNVLKALQMNFPDVQFVASFRGDTTANGGNLATSSTVAFANNGDALKIRIPVPLTIGEITKPSSFEFRVDSKFRIAGLDVLEATAGRRLTGL